MPKYLVTAYRTYEGTERAIETIEADSLEDAQDEMDALDEDGRLSWKCIGEDTIQTDYETEEIPDA